MQNHVWKLIWNQSEKSILFENSIVLAGCRLNVAWHVPWRNKRTDS